MITAAELMGEVVLTFNGNRRAVVRKVLLSPPVRRRRNPESRMSRVRAAVAAHDIFTSRTIADALGERVQSISVCLNKLGQGGEIKVVRRTLLGNGALEVTWRPVK